MDKTKTALLFYTAAQNLTNHFSNVQFDTFHFEKPQQITSPEDLLQLLEHSQPRILFFVRQKMEVQQRLFLKKLSRDYPDLQIVLCADETFALDAWNFDLLYFLAFPILQSSIDAALKKYLRQTQKHKEPLIKIKYNGGFYAIAPSKVLYCKGSGNYTQIYLKSGKNILVTAQLQKINAMLAGSRGIERVGKSFIFNLDNIREIGGGTIRFFSDQAQTLKISDNYIRRIKKLLLGIQN